MKIKIYQINLDRDKMLVAFEGAEALEALFGSFNIDSSIYDMVYSDEVECDDLEAVFQKFNFDYPENYTGRSMSVSDVIEVVDAGKPADSIEPVEPGCYYCDSVGFRKITFDAEQAQNAFESIEMEELQ